MSEHGGQPQWPGWIEFDVKDVTVTELTGIAPQNIVPINKEFVLSVTFDGGGAIWDWLETFPNYGLGIKYRVRFYAERIGYNAMDFPIDVATDEGILNGGPYTVKHTVPANTLQEGLYRMGVTVTFPAMAGSPGVPWAAGFYEGLVIEAITV